MSLTIGQVWSRIREHAGEVLRQIRSGEFTYDVDGDYVNLHRTNRRILPDQPEFLPEATSFYCFSQSFTTPNAGTYFFADLQTYGVTNTRDVIIVQP